MNNLPDELYLHIFENLLPDKSCDLNEFKNYFLVNKQWNELFNSTQLKMELKHKYNLLIYESLTYNKLITQLCLENIMFKINYSLLYIIDYIDLINLPVCKFTNSSCIDNMCHLKKYPLCYYNNHNISRYITAPLMRGIDDLGRIYLLFTYMDLETNEYMYEFIYHKTINNTGFLTFSGAFNKTYIGMLSENKLNNDYLFDRELKYDSLNYMKKLLNNERCGIPEYNHALKCFNESKDKGNIVLI